MREVRGRHAQRRAAADERPNVEGRVVRGGGGARAALSFSGRRVGRDDDEVADAEVGGAAAGAGAGKGRRFLDGAAMARRGAPPEEGVVRSSVSHLTTTSSAPSSAVVRCVSPRPGNRFDRRAGRTPLRAASHSAGAGAAPAPGALFGPAAVPRDPARTSPRARRRPGAASSNKAGRRPGAPLLVRPRRPAGTPEDLPLGADGLDLVEARASAGPRRSPRPRTSTTLGASS